MAQQYQPGQRWISDSEAELGLGTVLAQDGRLLTVLYPATGDTRQYALRNAPLTRVRFSPGDTITHFEGWKLTVREVDDVDGLLVYHGLNGQNEAVTLPETQLSNFIQFRLASDRLFAGQIDPLPWFPCATTPWNTPAASCSPRCGAWAACVRNRSRTSCTSPAKSPTVSRHGFCWPTKWAWARPSKPAW
jgi:hypothetical protein